MAAAARLLVAAQARVWDLEQTGVAAGIGDQTARAEYAAAVAAVAPAAARLQPLNVRLELAKQQAATARKMAVQCREQAGPSLRVVTGASALANYTSDSLLPSSVEGHDEDSGGGSHDVDIGQLNDKLLLSYPIGTAVAAHQQAAHTRLQQVAGVAGGGEQPVKPKVIA